MIPSHAVLTLGRGWPVWPEEGVMGRNRDSAPVQRPKLPTVGESQSQQDQQFEERLRIAEHLVLVLHEAGYSCDLGEGGPARALKPLN